MEFHANEGKKVEIEVNGEIYLRHAIKTRFVKQGESYIDLFKEYVSPIYHEGDSISASEKIILNNQKFTNVKIETRQDTFANEYTIKSATAS